MKQKNIKEIYDANAIKYLETNASGSKIPFQIKAIFVICYLIVVPFIAKINIPFRKTLLLIWVILFLGSIFYIPTFIGKLLAYSKIKKDIPPFVSPQELADLLKHKTLIYQGLLKDYQKEKIS